jgi:hypothetical protein
MGDAKSRQRMKGGSHGNGRVSMEISPVLGSGSGGQQRDDWNGECYDILILSHFLFPSQKPLLPKITLHRKRMYWHLVAMFVSTRAVRTKPATVTTLTERGLIRQNVTNLEFLCQLLVAARGYFEVC